MAALAKRSSIGLPILLAILTCCQTVAAGTWQPVDSQAPDNIDTMLLLPDGTVMAFSGSPNSDDVGNAVYRLTPDIHGSYANGAWSTLAPMHDTRLYYSSQVLTDGRVFVAGGEFGTGTPNAEIYDPSNNVWTRLPPSGQQFFDSESMMLPSGNVLITPVEPNPSGAAIQYSPVSNAWFSGGTLVRGKNLDEANWCKLPDNSILSPDPPESATGSGTNCERYIPALNQWINDATMPASPWDFVKFETGPGFLCADGRAFFLGSPGTNLFYTPSGNTSPGLWTLATNTPDGLGNDDAPAAMLVTGNILCALGPNGYVGGASNYPGPTTFLEFNPVTDNFIAEPTPTGSFDSDPPFIERMLDLPDGTVLFSSSTTQLYIYTPGGPPLAAGKPAIISIVANTNGTYLLTGTLLNGISEGAEYGDDAQMDSNYPLIRLTDANGNVFYARTFNWSSTGVMTGNTPVTAEFSPPSGLPAGIYSLVVVANGFSSDAIPFPPAGLQITPASGFAATGQTGGPFSPASQNYSLTNLGAAVLNWTLANTNAWLNASPTGGALAPGGPQTTVTVSLSSAANTLPAGNYAGTVWFTNLNDGSTQSRQFSLQIQPKALVQNGGFETGNFSGWQLAESSPGFDFVTNGSFDPAIAPHSGNYAALLGEPSPLGFLSQTIPTSPGTAYLLSLWLNSPDGATPNEFLVAWNGSTLFDHTNLPATGWTNLQFVVTTASSNTVLQFGFRDDESYLGLDDISVTALAAPAFQTVSAANSVVSFTWSTVPGALYQIQSTTNLAQPNWINLSGAVPATNSTASASDAIGPDPQRFYRVRLTW